MALISSLLSTCGDCWLVKMRKSCTEKPAFVCSYEIHQFKVILFGFMSAPSTFERMIDKELMGLYCIWVYQHHVLSFRNQCANIWDRFDAVLICFSAEYVEVKISKCSSAWKEVYYLGYIVDSRGVLSPHLNWNQFQCSKNERRTWSLKVP